MQVQEQTFAAAQAGDPIALDFDSMATLQAGARLGPYEIQSVLGAGGMGEVYRARDTRLGRIVAIKLIRSEFAQRDDFRHRFEREARTISALNHPHICGLYDVGERDGFAYLVMEYVEGETLAEVLRKGLLSLDLALRYGAEIADALAAAHARGMVHRDLKPANIMITEAGVKVLDFGLAKRSHQAAPEEVTKAVSSGQTRDHQVLGTVAYMSPEQADGKPLDAHSDMFSLGVVLYEMLCGRRPFGGDTTLSTLAAILRETPEPPRKLRHEVPERVERIVLRCLEKRPEARYPSAAELHSELETYQRGGTAKLRRPVAVAAALLLLLAVGALGTRTYVRASRARWAEKEALPEVARLMSAGRPLMALRLLQQAEQYAPSSAESLRLKDSLFISRVSIQTNPAGADVYVRDYSDGGDSDLSHWERLGRSPVEVDRMPRGYYRFRAVKDGFEPVELAAAVFGQATIELHAKNETPSGMVWIPGIGKGSRGTGQAFPAVIAEEVPQFWLDRHEVTNLEFKDFVDRGGYQKREYWKQPFVKEGRTLAWEQAMAELRDATGKPGPATWGLGTYPEGKADFPVGGVSWYEAAAYAEFAGKSLPTVYHWYRAADVGGFNDVLKFSNFGGQGPARVENSLGLGSFGTYDMAGNVKEWVLNPNGDRRYILGGGWNEPSYQFSRPDARRPFDREATFGFRCAKYISAIPAALAGPVPFADRDRRKDKPADDQAFQIFKSLHAYDKTELKPQVESIEESSPYWRKENVTFQAAYGNERVLAHLYLPRNATPPYQVVTFLGGTGVLTMRSVDDELAGAFFGFVVRSGRALMLPAYKGTLERGPGAYYHQLGQPNLWREMNLQWSKDLGRSIDYLETRSEIDAGKLAYLGLSMGSAMAPRLLAVEPRFKAAVLLSGGAFEKVPPEVDAWNFAPRVKIPVLMLNGRDDFLFPLETSQIPLFRMLGTPEKDKKQVLYDGGHNIGNTGTRLDVVKEALDWLDRYLGPVNARP